MMQKLLEATVLKKEKDHLDKIKAIISERLDCNFKEILHGDRELSEVLKETILSNQNDENITLLNTSNKILEIKFYDNIKDKNFDKKGLIILKKKYEKQIISAESMSADFSTIYSNFLGIISICVSVIGFLLSNIFNEDLVLKIILLGIIFCYMVYIIIANSIYSYYRKCESLIKVLNKFIESFILDIDQRLYEIEHKIIEDNGYTEYNIRIKQKNS